MKTETNIHELAIRYFEGHISKSEEKLLFSYIEQAEENRLRFRQWEKEWKVTNEGDEQTMHEWQRLQRRLRTQEAIMPMLPRRYFSFWRRVAAVAAIVVLTAGATLGIWNIAYLSSTEDYFVFEAPYGEKSKMTLADGTVVWLNAGSVLSIRISSTSGIVKLYLAVRLILKSRRRKKPSSRCKPVDMM